MALAVIADSNCSHSVSITLAAVNMHGAIINTWKRNEYAYAMMFTLAAAINWTTIKTYSNDKYDRYDGKNLVSS